MFDRILLILLILLLPLGILASRVITGELPINSKMTSEQEKKIQTAVDKLSMQITQPRQTQGEITITAVIYSTTSASLKVSGVAPATQSFIWVWSASSKSKKIIKIASESASSPNWSGPLVIWPNSGGSFTASIDVTEMAGVVEMRLEQAKVETFVKYDLDNQKVIQ